MRPFALLFLLLVGAMPAAGQNWTVIPLGTALDLNALEKGSFASIYLVGDGGYVAQSDATQMIWTPVDVGTTADLLAVHQPSSGNPWVGGQAGVVRRRVDGVWENRDIPNASEDFVLFTRNSGASYAAGTGGSIYRSTDDGVNWTLQTSGTANALHDGNGFTSSAAIVVGDEGTILKTLNGGGSWTPKTSGTTADLYAYQDVANNWILVAGEGGTILRSTNNGDNWTQVDSGTPATIYDLDSSGQNAFFVLAVGAGGVVLRSTDAGATWCHIESETSVDLHAVDMVSNATHTIAGDGGHLAVSTNSGGGCFDPTEAGVFESSASFRISGPWPQPVIGNARLRFEVDRDQRLRADLFEVNGRKIRTLLDAQLVAGQSKLVELEAENLPAGIYFIRTRGLDETETRKIVIIR